ncbi:MAG TPA: T9SS type A sorting domain-containing protein [candidate division Zixibacteria bacterium]|nr:T9SS type A sorting domain-containing protein [candidate division Zixibacteria bacterium]HEQ98925.1 T9SS type A sorting domain-containing protein [candidate division Zixibacteria bacterium]
MKVMVHLVLTLIFMGISNNVFSREDPDRPAEKIEEAEEQAERVEISTDAEKPFQVYSRNSGNGEFEQVSPEELAEKLAEKAAKENEDFQILLPQNYPNPFNSSTVIKYSLPVEAYVYIAVYNIFGQKVRIIKDEIDFPGDYEVTWNGRNEDGASLSSGVYFYIFAADNYYTIGKMIHLK